MSGPTELAVASGLLVDVALKSTVLLGAAYGLTRLPVGSGSQRHALWTGVMCALPMLPVLAYGRGAELALQATWLPTVWLAGVLLSVLPLLTGLVRVWRLTRAAEAHPSLPGVVMSPTIAGPATWGLWRPVVLLPMSAQHWCDQQVAAALTHERAHIARGDWAVAVGARLVCALLWFQPLVWLARRELGLEAEHAADDAVMRSGVRPSSYAELLLSVACGEPPPAALGAGSSVLGRRVHAVLGQKSRRSLRWPIFVAVLLLASLTVPALASWPAWSAPPPDTLTCS